LHNSRFIKLLAVCKYFTAQDY